MIRVLLLCLLLLLPQSISISVTGVVSRYLEPIALDVQVTPTLYEFTHTVGSGDGDVVVGVWVEDTFAYPVEQQPRHNNLYVSVEPGIVTQFSIQPTLAFLAHNTLAGIDFYDLRIGQRVAVVYGDDEVAWYRVVDVQQYQALTPHSPYSQFLSVDGEQLTATQLFDLIYNQGDRIVFQTCVQVGSEPSWGRLFVIALPD